MDLLMGIITRHWDSGKAKRAMDMIVRSKEMEKEAGRARERQRERLNNLRGSVRTLKRSPGRRAEIGSRENVRMGNALGVSVPDRKASLRKVGSTKGQEGKGGAAGNADGNSGDAPTKREPGRWSWVWW